MRLKQRTGGMEVLDQMTVGRDSFLVVVKVQEKILLLGVSPSGIEKLDKLDSYEKMEPAEAPPDFVAVLSSQLKARRRGEDAVSYTHLDVYKRQQTSHVKIFGT